MTEPAQPLFAHATCVAIDGCGVLLRGPAGAGKSDLALRLIDGGAFLVADDVVALTADGERLMATLPASAPASCRGRIEMRGLGILPVPTIATVPIRLVVDLVPGGHPERLPERETVVLAGLHLPLCRLDPFEASAPARVRLMVRAVAAGIIAAP
ncbi:MAG: HPr kinase/phosphatase C-terminal domain-containing protein [Rhodospirillaceae bacterium]|nr:HPr kinase/phosphatase C-terminal domain-containing protein [Rhodospirillaceae bacterium]